jgi:hypothetical protein
MTTVVIIEGVVIALLVVLMAGLLKSHAEILRQLDALGAGEVEATGQRRQPRTTGFVQAPTDEIVGVDPAGAATSVSLRHGRGETLLAFLSTGCASCQVFWAEMSSESRLPTSRTRPLIVTKGPGAESPARVRDLAPAGMKVIMSDDAWDAYRVPLTPYFMLVDDNGNVIGEGSATDMSRLLDLFEQAVADSNPTRLNTKQRERFTDERLSRSGVEPGDRSLYEDPLE